MVRSERRSNNSSAIKRSGDWQIKEQKQDKGANIKNPHHPLHCLQCLICLKAQKDEGTRHRQHYGLINTIRCASTSSMLDPHYPYVQQRGYIGLSKYPEYVDRRASRYKMHPKPQLVSQNITGEYYHCRESRKQKFASIQASDPLKKGCFLLTFDLQVLQEQRGVRAFLFKRFISQAEFRYMSTDPSAKWNFDQWNGQLECLRPHK